MSANSQSYLLILKSSVLIFSTGAQAVCVLGNLVPTHGHDFSAGETHCHSWESAASVCSPTEDDTRARTLLPLTSFFSGVARHA